MKRVLIFLVVFSFLLAPVNTGAQTNVLLQTQIRQQLINQLLALIVQLKQQLAILQARQNQTISHTQAIVPLVANNQSSSISQLDFTGFLKSSIGRFINTDIVVDTDSFSISDKYLNEFLKTANNILVNRADTEIKLLKIRRISYRALSSCTTNCFSPDREIFYRVYKTDPEPEFIIFWRADNTAALYGGYADSYESQNRSYYNRFISANNYSNRTGRIYIAVVDWNEMFAMCGYDRSDLRNPKHVSDVSVSGECQNTLGTACILKDDYYQCNVSESLNSPYSTRRIARASTVIHELMHQFGKDGIDDHYGGTKCVMPTITLHDLEDFAGICPRVFENFKSSYQ